MKSQRLSIKECYYKSFSALKSNPRLFIPFLIFALIEILSLSFFYIIPRDPLRQVFGPIISTFWGERFLHYPLNFLLLPKLVFHAKIFSTVIFGSLLTGMAVEILRRINTKEKIQINDVFINTLKKYIPLFVIILIICLIVLFSGKILKFMILKYFQTGRTRLLFLSYKAWSGPVMIALNIITSTIIQCAFTYAMPALIIGKKKLFGAIANSFILLKKMPLPTLVLVGFPMLCFLPLTMLNYNAVFLMDKFFPEVILLVQIFGILVNALVVDPLITVSTGWMYIYHEEQNKN